MSKNEVLREVSNSASPDLSSPPRSPDSPHYQDTVVLARPNTSAVSYPSLPSPEVNAKNDGGEKSQAVKSASDAKTRGAPAPTPAPVLPVKRTRKKKELPGAATPEVKEKKPRKTRVASSSAATKETPKRRVKADATTEAKGVAPPLSRQPKITELVGPAQSPPFHDVPTVASPSQSGNNEVIANIPNVLPLLGPGQQTQRSQQPQQTSPRSGQNYDPIRSSAMEAPKSTVNNQPNITSLGPPQPPLPPPSQLSPLRSSNRASESPSISSLINPTNESASFPFTSANLPSPVRSKTQDPNMESKPYLSPPAQTYEDVHTRGLTPTPHPTSAPNLLSANPPNTLRPSPPASTVTAMDVDTESTSAPPMTKATSRPRKSSVGGGNTSTGPSSTAHSPKPPREKKDKSAPTNLPGLPTSGSGLLTSSLFGGSSLEPSQPERSAPNIVLRVKLTGDNQVVNFARLAEERYGFDALYPRLAAQRERLARVAAAGAALENAGKTTGSGANASADEMSVDLSEADMPEGGLDGADSNVEMGGTGESGTDKKPAPKKRKMKEDQYDKEDPFVDDSELAWEEQAAASKDGFFVYQGPLVAEGEKPVVERADGTTAKRGRGSRGRGSTSTRGSRGGAASGSGTSTTGTGTRGGGQRKPRVSKAQKEKMEHEKLEREKLGEKMAILQAKPPGFQVTPAIAAQGAGTSGGEGMVG